MGSRWGRREEENTFRWGRRNIFCRSIILTGNFSTVVEGAVEFSRKTDSFVILHLEVIPGRRKGNKEAAGGFDQSIARRSGFS